MLKSNQRNELKGIDMKLNDFDQSHCSKFSPNSDMSSCTYYELSVNENENGFCKRPEFYRCLATTVKVIPLSHSSVQDFLTCHQLYYLRAIRGIQTKKSKLSSPLKMGSLWDSVLQKYIGKTEVNIADIINEYEIDDKDVAKVKGLFRAYKELEIVVEEGGNLQAKIDLKVGFENVWHGKVPVELLITGYYDRKYQCYFVENKLSSRPESYLDPYFINSQVGTYFLADTSLEYCIMEVVRTPALKSTGKNKEENADELCERIYQDCISRPSYYFIGYDNKTKKYGKKFYRSEFDLEDIKSRYLHIFREIFDARVMNGWYKNNKACNNVLPGISCDLLGICKTGNMSEEVYSIREKKVKF